jgi:O-antigen ligase
MFLVLGALITYSLLTFGAVLPDSWSLLLIFWSVSIAGWVLIETFKGQPWKASYVVAIGVLTLVLWLIPMRFALSLAAGIWAWVAARRSQKGTLRFFKILLVIGILEALLGLVQFFVNPGWIFGYINTSSRSSGTLINRNHFAGLLEMLIPISFGYAYMSARRFGDFARSYIYLLAGAFMALSLLFSLSRMGIFSFLATLCFLTIIVRWRKSQQRLATGLAFSVAGLMMAGALWIGVDVIVQRYSELVGQDALLREGRIIIFRDAAKMVMANPFGVGVGKFQDRFREYQTSQTNFLFDHAHNDYLETAAEWGIPLAIVFWTFVLFALWRTVRMFLWVHSPEQRGILLACAGSIFSILIHSLTDFNLQIPSNAMLFFTFVGISMALPHQENASSESH